MNEREELEALRRLAELEAKAAGNSFGDSLSQANQAQSRQMMTHPVVQTKPKDLYAKQAGEQSFLQNILAGAGGALYGLGTGLTMSPNEVKDWKASMSGLGTTVGGTLGQIAGYSAPAALAAPFAGASVPDAAGVGALEGALIPAESFGERGVNTLASTVGAPTGQLEAMRFPVLPEDRRAPQAARRPAGARAHTATATEKVRLAIVRFVGMRSPRVGATSPLRSNLAFDVLHCSSGARLRALVRLALRVRRPGIIYCPTTRDVDELYTVLQRFGVPSHRYHGKMNASERAKNQEGFMSRGRRTVMVATSAFGLGIDKPDIRYVMHYQAPSSLEQYVQEAGRAGRAASDRSADQDASRRVGDRTR